MNLADLLAKKEDPRPGGKKETPSPETVVSAANASADTPDAAPASLSPPPALPARFPRDPAPADGAAQDLDSVETPKTVFDNRPAEMYKLAEQMGIDVPVSKDVLLKKASACLHQVFADIIEGKPDKPSLWAMAKSVAGDIKGVLNSNPGAAIELQAQRDDRNRLVWHSLYTSILAMELVGGADVAPCTTQEIGAGALLHDIGLLVLPNLSARIRDENASAYAEHVEKSVQLAEEMAVPECVLGLIAQHHERMDGKGFPKGISGDEMPLSSQILAVSNLFEHALIAVTSGGQSRAEGIDISDLFKVYRKAFDNDLMKKMIHIIGFYPVGSIVELNNRSVCSVVRQNTDSPLRPVVKVLIDGAGIHPEQEKIIDLQKTAMLSITRTITQKHKGI